MRAREAGTTLLAVRRRALVLPFALVLFACQKESTLEQAHESGSEPTTPIAAPQPTSEVPTGEKALDDSLSDVKHDPQPSSAQLDPDGVPIPSFAGAAQVLGPGDATDAVPLQLALLDEAHYRITTIGMLYLPLIDKPTGFAREEDLTLSECSIEGPRRSCMVTHTFRNYEAEPPAGGGLEAEERLVAGVTTKHRIDSSGLRTSPTALSGDDAALAQPVAQALVDAHEFFCIRLPETAVGTGATWKDVCRRRQSGTIVTRDLTWKLHKLEDGPEGKRAELHYAGNVWSKDQKGVRRGKVQGVLYFLVDAGEPHLQRERVEFMVDADKGMKSATDLRMQWTKVGDDGETLVRTDGKPFEQSPYLLNDGRSLGTGPTRDGELPKLAEPGKKKNKSKKAG